MMKCIHIFQRHLYHQLRSSLRRRFQRTQEDVSYTILALIPTLSGQILDQMNIETLTQELQNISQARNAARKQLQLDPLSLASSIVDLQDTRSDVESAASHTSTSFVKVHPSSHSGLQSWVKLGWSLQAHIHLHHLLRIRLLHLQQAKSTFQSPWSAPLALMAEIPLPMVRAWYVSSFVKYNFWLIIIHPVREFIGACFPIPAHCPRVALSLLRLSQLSKHSVALHIPYTTRYHQFQKYWWPVPFTG